MDLLQLKSDFQFAQMCHEAQGTELTKLNLVNAEKAYNQALSEAEELEDPEDSNDEGETPENQTGRESAIESIAELVNRLTADEFQQLQAALEEQLRITPAAQPMPLVPESGIVKRITVPASILDHPTGQAAGAGEPAAESSVPAEPAHTVENADAAQAVSAPASVAGTEAIKPAETKAVSAGADEKEGKSAEKKSSKKVAAN